MLVAKFVRVGSVAAFAVLLLSVGVPAARADYWAAWKWNGQSGIPAECIAVGTNLLTASTPDKHNVDTFNACAEAQPVGATLIHFDSAGRIIDECNPNGITSTNNYTCSLQATTLSGDYWEWAALIGGPLEGMFSISCSNQNRSYQYCFS